MYKEFLGEPNIELMIQDIEKHPILYNCESKHFKHLQDKNLLWSELSHKYNINAKQRYKSLRDRYVREKKRIDQQLLIYDKVEYPTWEYYSHLSFLNKYMRKKRNFEQPIQKDISINQVYQIANENQQQSILNESVESVPLKIKCEYIHSNDFIMNNNDIEMKPNLDEINMENKCGQIYLENGKFIFLCDFCEQLFNDINIYMEHIINYHKLNESAGINYLIDENSTQALDRQQENISFSEPNEIEISCKKDTINYFKTDSNVIDPLSETSLMYEIEYFDENNSKINNAEEINEKYNIQGSPRKSVINYDKPPKLLNENNEYPCTQCNKAYTIYKSLCDHFRIRHASKCEYCLKKFSNLHSLQTHLNEVHPENNEKSIIPFNANDESEYDINYLTKTTQNVPLLVIDEPIGLKNKDGRFICTLCDVTYTRYDSIRKHYRFVHLNLAKFKYCCNQCDKKYHTKSHLHEHMNVHKGMRPFKCDICKSDFTHRNYLKSHMRIHSDEKPHSCTYCGKKFVRHYEKMNHERAIHTNERIYQCNDCGDKFVRNSQLKQHCKIKHENNAKYQCNECDKKYFTQYNLRAHMHIHKGLRPFKCGLCTASFTHRNILTTHVQTHLNEKRHSCLYCGKKFLRKYDKMRHERSIHTK